jgi:hypothetical protein
MPDFSTNPTEAIGAFSEEVKGQLAATGEQIAELGTRIEAVENRPAPVVEDLDEKFAKLATGEQFSEVADRLKAVETKVERQRQFGSGQQERKSPWAQHIESAEFAAYVESGCKADGGVRTKAPLIITPARGQFAVTVDDSLVGVLDRPHDRPGVIELLRDPVGLVDVINTVAPINSQTYQYYMETAQSQQATLGTKLTVAIDGDPTPKTTCTVANSEGFVPTRPVRFYTAAGVLIATKNLVSKADSTGVLTFATDDLDFDAAINDVVTSDEYLATQEGALKPAGFIGAEQKTIDLQTFATWMETTRQRLMYTNHTDLASWINMRLPKRHNDNIEWHLLYGSGESNDELRGFLNATYLPSGQTDVWSTDMNTGDSRADLVLWSATQIPGDVRTVAVLNKNDWFRILNYKTSHGDYLQASGQGPQIINTPGLKAIGNVQVVLSRYVVETTGLVFAPEWASELVPAADAELWTGFVGEQRIYNKQTHLYEQSLAHALKDTQAWRKVSFDGAPA